MKTLATVQSRSATKEEAANYLHYCTKVIDGFRDQGKLRPPVHPGIRQKVLIPWIDIYNLEQELIKRRERGRQGDALTLKTKKVEGLSPTSEDNTQ